MARRRKRVATKDDIVAKKIREQGNLEGFTRDEIDALMQTELENVQFAIDGLGKMKTRDMVVFDLVEQKNTPVYIARAIVDTAIGMIAILGENLQGSLLSTLTVQYGRMLDEIDNGLSSCTKTDHVNRQKYIRLKNDVVKTMMNLLPQTHIIHQTNMTTTMSADDVRKALIQTYGGPVYDVEPDTGDNSSDDS